MRMEGLIGKKEYLSKEEIFNYDFSNLKVGDSIITDDFDGDIPSGRIAQIIMYNGVKLHQIKRMGIVGEGSDRR